MAEPLPRSVKRLGLASLFTDAASEAIYPLLPLFVTRVLGGRVAALGLIEGAAEAASSLFKLLAGQWSDRTGRRRPFVLTGYAVASLARPLVSLATTWPHVFAVRLVDRLGKGLRGAPRDAMLGALAPSGQRGRVFGFHRAMDHAGAVIGPLAASAFLWWAPNQFRLLFALTTFPGALAVVMVGLVPEPRRPGVAGHAGVSADARHDAVRAQADRAREPGGGLRGVASARPLPRALKRFLVILTIFMLGNSTDAFLLLRLSEAGLGVAVLPLAWAGLHVVKAGLSTSGGTLSDRFGRRRLIVGGWLLYAVVYAGFAVAVSLLPLIAWFLLYGVHFAMVEGSEKALVADLTAPDTQGTAFGWYNAVAGFGALAASVLFGLLWERFGHPVAFLTGAALALMAAALLAREGR